VAGVQPPTAGERLGPRALSIAATEDLLLSATPGVLACLVWARLRKDPRFRQAARHSALYALIMIPLTVTIFSGPTLQFSTFYLWLLAWFAW
jgi:hypothetical protein